MDATGCPIPLPNLSFIFRKFTEKADPESFNSQHDWCKKPDLRNSKHLSLFESTLYQSVKHNAKAMVYACVTTKTTIKKEFKKRNGPELLLWLPVASKEIIERRRHGRKGKVESGKGGFVIAPKLLV